MIFGRRARKRFLEAVAGFEAAVRERDGERGQGAIQQIHGHFGDAEDHELVEAGPRLAALLPDMPEGARDDGRPPGACGERGADATRCATPGGEWVWNEGTPSDIPVVDVRLLVLEPPPYARGRPAGRFFPGMTADLVLERVLDQAETGRWLEHCAPAN